MRNDSSAMPNGLLQTTQLTDAVTVTIKRLVDDNTTEDIISFTNAHDIQAFYTQRGVGLGISQQTNVIAVRVLAHELLKKSQHQQQLGLETAPDLAEQARQLHAAAQGLKKDDALICSFDVKASPLTM